MAKNTKKPTKAPKNKGGRPPFKPTDEERYSVEIMASIGIPQDQISTAIGITKKTLQKHFRNELDTGRTKTITKVADSLVRQALAGNMTAAIFYLKTQAGWKEVSQHEHTGKDGEALPPIEVRIVNRPSGDGAGG